MRKPLMRIPFTGPLPAPQLIPRNVNTLPGAVAAISQFLLAPPPDALKHEDQKHLRSTVVLSGAGISVASGLADYRGTNGTYRRNATYRPIYYHEFLESHEARKRYWARSFLGWSNLYKATPNATHYAIRDLAELGLISEVITQNVDSFHSTAHPELKTLELHGYLRALICTTCRREMPRGDFQRALASLNPKWSQLLDEVVQSGALETEDPQKRRALGMRTNPDGDVDLPDAPYTTFRYPACPHCLKDRPYAADGTQHVVEVDRQGALTPASTAGILKPGVVMFGESLTPAVKEAADRAIDTAGKLLILGTSLATYSAWRLAKRALEQQMPVAIINLGGVRGEDAFFQNLPIGNAGSAGARIELASEAVLPKVVDQIRRTQRLLPGATRDELSTRKLLHEQPFKDMLS